MKRWLAAKLWPEFERTEGRFWYLWHQTDDVNKWCDGEARDATQWLLDQDRDHWRSIDAPAGARATPWGIQQFREWIYKKRDDEGSLKTIDPSLPLQHSHKFEEVLFREDGLTRRCQCGAHLWEPDASHTQS